MDKKYTLSQQQASDNLNIPSAVQWCERVAIGLLQQYLTYLNKKHLVFSSGAWEIQDKNPSRFDIQQRSFF